MNPPMKFDLPPDDNKGKNEIVRPKSPEALEKFISSINQLAEGERDVRTSLSFTKEGVISDDNIDRIFKLGLYNIVEKLQHMEEVPNEENQYGEFEVWVGNRISHTLNHYLFYKDKITDRRTIELVRPLFMLIASVHEFTQTSEPNIYKFYKESEMLSDREMAFVIARRLQKLPEISTVKEQQERIQKELLVDLEHFGFNPDDIENLLKNPENKRMSYINIYQNILKMLQKHPYMDEKEKSEIVEKILKSVE